MQTHSNLPLLLEESLEVKCMKYDLTRMLTFDRHLNFPSSAFPCIHVAGTNGKGSVALKIASALQAGGFKTGLYTSPHIQSYRERIRIDQQMIEEEEILEILEKIYSSINTKPSYFEALTLAAFIYFAEQKVEIAVLETGLGGRLDATNICHPLLSVITTIGKDHTRILGKTCKEIALEKAGIIKPGIPVVLGPKARPFKVFEAKSVEMQSPLFRVKGSFQNYETENEKIAELALKTLPLKLDDQALKFGLRVRPACRFEKICPKVVLDVGHNPSALKSIFKKLSLEFPLMPVRVLAAFSEDKEVGECLKILKKHARAIHLTQARHERALPIDVYTKEFIVEKDLNKALTAALKLSEKNGEILLICGTFFIMDDVLKKLREDFLVD